MTEYSFPETRFVAGVGIVEAGQSVEVQDAPVESITETVDPVTAPVEPTVENTESQAVEPSTPGESE